MYENVDGRKSVELICSRDLRNWERVAERQPFIEQSPVGDGSAYDTAQLGPANRPIVRNDELYVLLRRLPPPRHLPGGRLGAGVPGWSRRLPGEAPPRRILLPARGGRAGKRADDSRRGGRAGNCTSTWTPGGERSGPS